MFSHHKHWRGHYYLPYLREKILPKLHRIEGTIVSPFAWLQDPVSCEIKTALGFRNQTFCCPSVTIVGAYIYAVFSMIASGVSLNSMEIKTIMVFLQNALLLVQVSCQGKISFHSLSSFIKTQSVNRQATSGY